MIKYLEQYFCFCKFLTAAASWTQSNSADTKKGLKMKLTTKLLALLLALLTLATSAVLTSCDNGDTPDGVDTTPVQEDTTPAETTPAPTVSNDLVVVKDGETEANVVRSDRLDSSAVPVTCAADIRLAVEKATGKAPKITTDWKKPTEAYDSEKVEILVGYTEYPESLEVFSELTYGQYIVKVVGNKLVVAGYSDTAIYEATRYVKKLIKENATENGFVIPADSYDSGIVDEDLNSLPGYENGTFNCTYQCGGKATLLLVKDTDVDAYNAYLAKLEKVGFKQYTTNEINGNYFATYNSDKYTVNLGFYDYENAARIIIEPLAKPVGLKEDNVYTPVTTSQITMIGLEYNADAGNGQSMLVRLTDGRFIVMDGGFNRDKCANLLIQQLQEQSKDYLKAGEKPVVAAWILTHTHGDHSGMLVNKYPLLKNKIKVEKIFVNLLSETERARAINLDPEDRWDEGEGSQALKVPAVAKSLGADVQYVHVGQVFYIADVKLDILYTIESFAPKLCNAFNTSSLTIKFTFDSGDTFLMTGDTTGNGMQIAAKMFGNYMQCELLQIAHHGYTTHGNDSGMIQAYKLVDPTTLLWPQGNTDHPSTTDRAFNKVLYSKELGGENPNYQEKLVAGAEGDIIICPIPYEAGNAIINRVGS